MTLVGVLALGFFLGMRHATDADHVVAVTTIVTRERTARAAMLVGALWGIGHTVTILVVGGALVVFGLVIPPRVGLSMELSVAVMLIVLGAMNLSGALRRIDHAAHGHDGHDRSESAHHAVGDAPGVGGLIRRTLQRGLRSLIVGVVHGLAGSAAIALLVLTTIREATKALLYLAIFGAGTILGMMLLTTAMSFPMAAASRRFASFETRLANIAGVASILFGAFLVYQIGFVDGLFLEVATWDPH